MNYLSLQEARDHGSLEFPAEYHYVTPAHPRHSMAFHWHREWELIRILEGNFSVHIDEDTYPAVPGDIFLLPSGALHGGTPDSDCVYECFVFDLHGLFREISYVKKHIRPFYQGKLVPFVHMEGNGEVASIADSLLTPFREQLQGQASRHWPLELIALGEISRLFAWIQGNGLYRETGHESLQRIRHIGKIRGVLEYIDAHFSEPISVSQLAEIVCMSPKHFSVFFSTVIHRPPMDYVNYFRVQEAAILLRETEQSVAEIGLSCGFCDSSHFIKNFKKYKGLTPEQYRRTKKS